MPITSLVCASVFPGPYRFTNFQTRRPTVPHAHRKLKLARQLTAVTATVTVVLLVLRLLLSYHWLCTRVQFAT